MDSRKSPDIFNVSTPGETAADDINQMNLALDRTILANERTYAAWIRTGLAALAAGLGIAKFMTGLIPLWSILIIAAVLIGFSSVAFLLAAWRYSHLHIKVSHLEVDAVPLAMIRSLSLLLVCCSMIALAGLWYMIA